MVEISAYLKRVDEDLIRNRLFHIAEDPIPCRTLVHTLPGHEKCTLYEADEFIAKSLKGWGYSVESEPVQVQAYRRNWEVQGPHTYASPHPDDPWYTAYNVYGTVRGSKYPNELIVVISHKDSQSWMVDTAGAYDNGIGTVGNMEIARVLQGYKPKRSLWFVYCNEEHTPWTSAVTAERVKEEGLTLVAALNVDSLGGKSAEDQDAGLKTNATRYVTDEGERIADLMAQLNDTYGIGLRQTKHKGDFPNDDDGSFIKAGMPAAVAMVGSFPYLNPDYHLESDTAEKVDIVNARMATQLALATVLHLDEYGPA
jgi:hypothetical protein